MGGGERERERETDRQTEIQRDRARDTERGRERQRDRETEVFIAIAQYVGLFPQSGFVGAPKFAGKRMFLFEKPLFGANKLPRATMIALESILGPFEAILGSSWAS